LGSIFEVPPSEVRHLDAGQGIDHLVGVGRFHLLDRFHPHCEADDVRFHRVVGGALGIIGECVPPLDEILVALVLDRLEVVPRREVPDQRLEPSRS
jgi:hypothetical protein